MIYTAVSSARCTTITSMVETDLTLTLPRDVLESARLGVQEVKQELAVSLYAQERLSVGKARELAEMSLWAFRQLLAARGIFPHFGVSDLEEDLETLQAFERP